MKDTMNRQKHLTELLEANMKYCIEVLGEDKLSEMMRFLEKKIDAENEPTESDITEFERLYSAQVTNAPPQTIITMFKILHLKMEIKSCKAQIEDIIKKVNYEDPF